MAAQHRQIQTITQLLTASKKVLAVDGSMGHAELISGELTLNELTQLCGERGSDLDQQSILAMFTHQEGAIENERLG